MFTNQHYESFADMLLGLSDMSERESMAEKLAETFESDNPNFNREMFFEAAGLDYDAPDYSDDDGLSDAEADAMTLASAGMGTDEDYGYYPMNSDDF